MRTAVSIAAAASAALLLSGCGARESAPIANTTEITPVDNLTTSDAMVTGIESVAPVDNAATPVSNAAGNAH